MSQLKRYVYHGEYRIIGDNNIFEFCEGLTSVYLMSGVEGVNRCTFMDCSNLTTVTMASSVERLDSSAFEDCEELIEVNCPGVKTISSDCFRGCSSLTRVDSGNLEAIGALAFKGCTSLETITGLNENTWVNSNAFEDSAWSDFDYDAYSYYEEE